MAMVACTSDPDQADSPSATSALAPPHAAQVQPGAAYVAMGSSFASGPGLIPVADEGCFRSLANYAHQVAAELELALTDVSCAGATSANLLSEPQEAPDRVRPPQLHVVTPDTEVISVTIGGNDVQYLSSLERFVCIDAGDCPESSVDRTAIQQELTAVGDRVTAVLAAIHARAPEARVLLATYPRIVPSTGAGCPALPLTADHATFMRAVGDQLDAAFRDAAQRSGAELVDIYSASSASGACESEQPWVGGVPSYTEPTVPTPFHPTAAGMRATAELIVRTLEP